MTLMASFGVLKAKLMYFTHRPSLKEGPPGKMSFSNLENPVYGLWSPPWPRNQVCHFSGSSHSLHADWCWLMNGGILLLQPLPPLSHSPLIYISSLLPCLHFGRRIPATGTAAVHVHTKCECACQDSEVMRQKKWVEINTTYWLFTHGK